MFLLIHELYFVTRFVFPLPVPREYVWGRHAGTKHSQCSLWRICWHLNWLLREFVFGWSLHDLWNPGIWPALDLDAVALSRPAAGTLSFPSSIFWTPPYVLTLWKPRCEKVTHCSASLSFCWETIYREIQTLLSSGSFVSINVLAEKCSSVREND